MIGARASRGRLRIASGDLLADVLAATSMFRRSSNSTMTIDWPGPGDRAQLADALHGVDDLLDLAGDLGLHLLGGGAGQLGADADGGEVDGREAVDAEADVRGGADHDERRARASPRTPAGGCRPRRASARLGARAVTGAPPAADRLPGRPTTGSPAVEAGDDLHAVASAAAGGHPHLHRAPVVDREHLLNSRERDDRLRGHGDHADGRRRTTMSARAKAPGAEPAPARWAPRPRPGACGSARLIAGEMRATRPRCSPAAPSTVTTTGWPTATPARVALGHREAEPERVELAPA